MWCIPIIIILLFLLGIVIGLRKLQEWRQVIDKSEHKLYLIYPMVDWILVKARLYSFLRKRTKVTDSLKALYYTDKPELLEKLYWCSRFSKAILVFVLFNGLSLLAYGSEVGKNILIEGNSILRPDYGEGEKKVSLKVKISEEDKTGADDNVGNNSNSIDVELNVDERKYTSGQTQQLFEKAIKYLEKQVLGNNNSSEEIYEDLNFITNIPDSSITVEWIPQDYKLIRADGSIRNEQIVEKGVTTLVTVILHYEKEKFQRQLFFTLLPPKISEDEVLSQNLKDEVLSYAEDSATSKYLKLPTKLNEYNLHWEEIRNSSVQQFIFLGVLFAIFVWYLESKELEKQYKRRKEQLQLDYPEIVNKFTLLINAGMSIRQAFQRIADEYEVRRQMKGFKKRYAFEEILILTHELKLGKTESIIYEQFGRRVGLISYMKFAALIIQNSKKGNKGFSQLLISEAREAFEDRMELARKRGEEAGTKLLIPMMLLLILVFLIIMIPAFMSFHI
jgi:hypothetical protein